MAELQARILFWVQGFAGTRMAELQARFRYLLS
jgi:hypothetical protein